MRHSVEGLPKIEEDHIDLAMNVKNACPLMKM